MPPIRVVAQALREATERLALELSQPHAIAPEWSVFEWRIAEAVIILQGISALLPTVLRWRGPPHWEALLAEQSRHTELRRRRIADLLARMDREARRAGIAFVALKGAALYEIGLYRAGERPMGDIDVLVRPDDLDSTLPWLGAIGYSESFRVPRHRVYEPDGPQGAPQFGEHIDSPIKVEVHGRIAEPLPMLETEITARVFPAQAHAGLNAYPSTASLMQHLLLHAAGNMRARALRLIQLHDVAQLSARMSERDWIELAHEQPDAPKPGWMLPPLSMTAHYYPGAIPDWVMSAILARCHGRLQQACARQRLTDVSWSNVRIEAFPGIEWANSPGEALRFMASRVFPDRKARSLLRIAATQQWGRGTPWYGLSHANRILRWVFSSPPRVQTMHAVSQALGRE